MRAREFTINVPINIKINGDGDPEIDVAGNFFARDGSSTFVPTILPWNITVNSIHLH